MESCKECSKRHNTLCHRSGGDKDRPREENVIERAMPDAGSKISSNVLVYYATNIPVRRQVLMATAIVNTVCHNGARLAIRILLDSASEANFVTFSACNKLGIKLARMSEIVTGLNELESRVSQNYDVVIQSRHSGLQTNVHCLVIPTITKKLPSVEIDRNSV